MNPLRRNLLSSRLRDGSSVEHRVLTMKAACRQVCNYALTTMSHAYGMFVRMGEYLDSTELTSHTRCFSEANIDESIIISKLIPQNVAHSESELLLRYTSEQKKGGLSDEEIEKTTGVLESLV